MNRNKIISAVLISSLCEVATSTQAATIDHQGSAIVLKELKLVLIK